jgi:hypothetical protein
MLTQGGAKLMDFGLAKPLGVQASAGSGSAPSFTAVATLSGPSPLSPLTTAGSIVGTIQYMLQSRLKFMIVSAMMERAEFPIHRNKTL